MIRRSAKDIFISTYFISRAMHIPVLLNEVMTMLNPQRGERMIDGTVGDGGHAAALIDRLGAEGALLGIDRDHGAVERCKTRFAANQNVTLLHDTYANMPTIIARQSFGKADGLLLDLGFSSRQLEEGERGLSFMRDEPLDMRYDRMGGGTTAAEVVNRREENELAQIIFRYGEERFARRIAKQIVAARARKPIGTTFDLVRVIEAALPSHRGRSRIHPATRTFQALRIYVNRELDELEYFLQHIIECMETKGRIVIISFHSLEDRLVKQYFRDMARRGTGRMLTKKPIRPSREEARQNPRSRSAKLRACVVT